MRVTQPDTSNQPLGLQQRPREVRPNSIRPGAEAARLHNLTHCPYQSWCEVCVASKGKSDHYHRETPQPTDGDVARIQMDFMFVGAEGTFVDEPTAKATVLMVMCKDDGCPRQKCVRKLMSGDGASIIEYVRMCRDQDGWGAQHRRDCSKDTSSTRQNNDSGTDECWRTSRNWSCGTFEWNSASAVASVLPGRARAYESENNSRYKVVSMDVSAFCLDGALPVRSKNETDSMGEQEVIGTNQRWYHLEKWFWRKLQTLTR